MAGSPKKKDVFISIVGKQRLDQDCETNEFYTKGSFYRHNDRYYITYTETEATGFAGAKTLVKVDGDQKVVMLRSGPAQSHLIMEKNRRCVGEYGLAEGKFFIGVTTEEIDNQLNEDGGRLYFRYQLDMNARSLSTNEVTITVRGQ